MLPMLRTCLIEFAARKADEDAAEQGPRKREDGIMVETDDEEPFGVATAFFRFGGMAQVRS